MSMQLRNVLFENYAKHYKRVNIGSEYIQEKKWDSFNIMFGKYLESLPPNSLVLDAGCGSGILLSHIEKWKNVEPVGVDISMGQIEAARDRVVGAQLICGDAYNYLISRKNRFSGIFCTDVLEHLSSEDQCFLFVQALCNALVPGGFCIVRTPNAANLTACYSRYMDLTHTRSFTRTSLMQLMEVGGFQNINFIPISAKHLKGRIRLFVEEVVHRAIFRMCGRGAELVYTSNVIVSGYAPV